MAPGVGAEVSIEGIDEHERPYRYALGGRLTNRTNSRLFEVRERADVVAKFPTKAESLKREVEVFDRLRAQPRRPVALTVYRGHGDDHVLLARLPHRVYRERLRDEQVLMIGLSLAEAIAYLVRLEIIHADLTPANVLLDAAKTTPYIIDFGTAIFSPVEMTLPRRDEESFWPVPEIYRHKPHDDVWSMLWILLSLRDPKLRPTVDGAIPAPVDQVDKPIINLLHDLAKLRERRDLVTALKGFYVTLRAQLRDLGIATTTSVYIPTEKTRERVRSILEVRQAERMRAFEGLDVPGFATTELEEPAPTITEDPTSTRKAAPIFERLRNVFSPEGE